MIIAQRQASGPDSAAGAGRRGRAAASRPVVAPALGPGLFAGFLAGLLVALGAGAAQATPVYTSELAVQRVSVCTDAGLTCWTPQVDAALLQQMYDPTGILLVLPAPIQLLNFTFTLSGGEVDIASSLADFASAMSPPAAPHTAWIGGTPEIAGSALGLAFVGAPSSPFGLVQATGELSTTAETSLFAHELGHILGAPHDGDGNTAPSSGFIMSAVMNPASPDTEFSSVSLLALEDAALPGEPGSVGTPVPLPAPGLLALAGLGALAMLRRRRSLSSPAGSS